MSQAQYEAALAKFLRTKTVIRCPTACVAPTHTAVADADRAALRDYNAGREAARMEKLAQLPATGIRLTAADPMR
jgi:hypothetical protein